MIYGRATEKNYTSWKRLLPGRLRKLHWVSSQGQLDRRRRTESHSAALGRSRSPDVGYLQLLDMRTEKQENIVSSSATDKELVRNSRTRPVGGGGEADDGQSTLPRAAVKRSGETRT
jgi:hypothetical protein